VNVSNYQDFEDRHIGPSSAQESEMLSVLGYSNMESFISDVVPSNIAIAQKLDQVLDAAKSETEVIAE
jgi:glycine dehydrogenase